jgi:hypothetical protein
MTAEAKSLTPAQRAQFLDFLQSLGGQPAVVAGLEALAKLDADKPLATVSTVPQGITVQVPPQLLTQIPGGAMSFGLPASDIWKWFLKLLECGLKNIALALQGKWPEFAAAVLTCVLAH